MKKNVTLIALAAAAMLISCGGAGSGYKLMLIHISGKNVAA